MGLSGRRPSIYTEEENTKQEFIALGFRKSIHRVGGEVGGERIWIVSQQLVPRLEKAMAPHSSTLAWKIPWTEEPGRLQSMGSRRVGHD